jgi:DNA-binding NarL/FixJ family response regulator
MNILINVSNQLISEAMKQLLTRNGYEHVIIVSKNMNGFEPAIVLVDSTTLGDNIFKLYPDAKVLLMDTGLGKEKLIAMLLSYKIHGILSTDMELSLLKKALQVVSEGQVWIDNRTVKSFLHDSDLRSDNGRMNGVTKREKEITDLVVQGYSNKEIGDKLCISEHTVKAHLNRIFRKFNTTSRSKLITVVRNDSDTRTATCSR